LTAILDREGMTLRAEEMLWKLPWGENTLGGEVSPGEMAPDFRTALQTNAFNTQLAERSCTRPGMRPALSRDGCEFFRRDFVLTAAGESLVRSDVLEVWLCHCTLVEPGFVS
jgi:hypothetical protein